MNKVILKLPRKSLIVNKKYVKIVQKNTKVFLESTEQEPVNIKREKLRPPKTGSY